jgi:hypothetical protein
MTSNEIRTAVKELEHIAYDSYRYSGWERDKAKEQIKVLWSNCEHKYEWIDCI